MKMFRIIFCLYFLAGFSLSIALADQEEDQVDIALLRNSAVALGQSRPDLAQALNAYADRLSSKTPAMSPEDYAKMIDTETENVKTAVTQFGNALLGQNRDDVEQLMYFSPDEVFDHKKGELRKFLESYHDKANGHDFVNFNIVSVKLNNDLTEAGVRIEGFFMDKNGTTLEHGEGWAFKRDKPGQPWLFDEVAYSAGAREHKK